MEHRHFGITLVRDWTTRQSTSFSYSARSDRLLRIRELGYDSRSQSANVDHNWRYSRVSGVNIG